MFHSSLNLVLFLLFAGVKSCKENNETKKTEKVSKSKRPDPFGAVQIIRMDRFENKILSIVKGARYRIYLPRNCRYYLKSDCDYYLQTDSMIKPIIDGPGRKITIYGNVLYLDVSFFKDQTTLVVTTE